MEKHFSHKFHIWKNACLKNFIKVFVPMDCMKMYDKKFLIYGNCIIKSIGQLGSTDSYFASKDVEMNSGHFWNNQNCLLNLFKENKAI